MLARQVKLVLTTHRVFIFMHLTRTLQLFYYLKYR